MSRIASRIRMQCLRASVGRLVAVSVGSFFSM